MKCRAKPYLGSEPFVFFSYCHKDSPRVYPLIEQLTALGYRIWFDDGIGIGDEWPEVIAKKLEECTLFLVAITPDYCRSHNCKNEMTYQVEDQKPMLPLMLEDFPLSGGIRLQLAGTQYLRLFEHPQSDWPGRVAASGMLEACKGAPIPIARPEPDPLPKTEPNAELKPAPVLVPSPEAPLKEAPSQEPPVERPRLLAVCMESGKVLFDRQGQLVLTPGQQEPGPVVTVSDGEILVENLGQQDVSVEDAPLAAGKQVKIPFRSPIRTNTGTYLPFQHSDAEILRQAAALRFLQADATAEMRLILSDALHLGRNEPWKQNVLSDHRVSRHHADICPDAESGKVTIKDFSRNGTYVNGKNLTAPAELSGGEEIRLGHDFFHYHAIPLDFSDEENEKIYDQAVALLSHDRIPEDLMQAERLFAQLGAFRNCGMMQLRCKEKLEILRQEKQRQQEALYQQALSDMRSGAYAAAREKFGRLQGYKDADANLAKCTNFIAMADDGTVVDRNDQTVSADDADDDGEKTIRVKPQFSMKEQLLIVELGTGEIFRGKYQSTIIGRKINQCDIPFPDNSCMSRRHTELFTLNGAHYVRDCNSSNGTSLNGQALERGQTVKIGDTALLSLAGTRLLAVFDEQAARLQSQENLVYLEDTETKALILGTDEHQILQAEDPEATVINGADIKRDCASFWQDEHGAWLEPEVDDCVKINGRILDLGEPAALADGDNVRIGASSYRFHSVRLISL